MSGIAWCEMDLLSQNFYFIKFYVFNMVNL